MTTEIRNCQNCKQSFVIDSEDFAFYEKMEVPPPTFCWICRVERRLVYRNERTLYRRKSGYTGKEIFSTFPPDMPYVTYESDIWYSDAWDPLSYGRDYDFNRPFFSQFDELMKIVPLQARSVISPVNSDYGNNSSGSKNCYLVFNTTNAEDCLYGNGVSFSKDCVDNSHISKSELCYGNFWLTRCSRAFFSERCEDCSDIWFSKDLRGCSNCFGCFNLRNKSYYIWNRPHSKEEYAAWLAKLNTGSFCEFSKWKGEFAQRTIAYPSKFIEGTHNSDVSGNYIFNSKNVKKSFLVRDGENLKYCQYLQEPPNKDCYDHTTWGVGNAFTYECGQVGDGANNVKFVATSWTNIRNIEYCYMCHSSSDLFGCVSLRNKQYCVLNKQYTKEKYEELVRRIKEQMMQIPYIDKKGREYRYGEFFPIEFSPFPYNETATQDYFRRTKSEVEALGYTWRDQPTRNYSVTMRTEDIPDSIDEVGDKIIEDIIRCAHRGECNDNCTTAFRITPTELSFYRRMKLPLPRLCPNCRTCERLEHRGTFKLWPRQCTCAGEKSENDVYSNTASHFHGAGRCPNEFETSYSPERKEIVYCESCYNSEVV